MPTVSLCISDCQQRDLETPVLRSGPLGLAKARLERVPHFAAESKTKTGGLENDELFLRVRLRCILYSLLLDSLTMLLKRLCHTLVLSHRCQYVREKNCNVR